MVTQLVVGAGQERAGHRGTACNDTHTQKVLIGNPFKIGMGIKCALQPYQELEGRKMNRWDYASLGEIGSNTLEAYMNSCRIHLWMDSTIRCLALLFDILQHQQLES